MDKWRETRWPEVKKLDSSIKGGMMARGRMRQQGDTQDGQKDSGKMSRVKETVWQEEGWQDCNREIGMLARGRERYQN